MRWFIVGAKQEAFEVITPECERCADTYALRQHRLEIALQQMPVGCWFGLCEDCSQEYINGEETVVRRQFVPTLKAVAYWALVFVVACLLAFMLGYFGLAWLIR